MATRGRTRSRSEVLEYRVSDVGQAQVPAEAFMAKVDDWHSNPEHPIVARNVNLDDIRHKLERARMKRKVRGFAADVRGPGHVSTAPVVCMRPLCTRFVSIALSHLLVMYMCQHMCLLSRFRAGASSLRHASTPLFTAPRCVDSHMLDAGLLPQ